MRILCFGDSNTYGYDPRGFLGDRYGAKDRWVELLTKRTGHEVINVGANGREIPRNPYALRSLTKYAPVDIFLVMLGTNDLLQGASAKEAAARMEVFLNQLLPHCKQILLIVPPPMKRGAWVLTDELVAESINLAEEYKLLAEKLNIPFVDTRHWDIEFAFDGVHFTEDGHHACPGLVSVMDTASTANTWNASSVNLWHCPKIRTSGKRAVAWQASISACTIAA